MVINRIQLFMYGIFLILLISNFKITIAKEKKDPKEKKLIYLLPKNKEPDQPKKQIDNPPKDKNKEPKEKILIYIPTLPIDGGSGRMNKPPTEQKLNFVNTRNINSIKPEPTPTPSIPKPPFPHKPCPEPDPDFPKLPIPKEPSPIKPNPKQPIVS